MLWPFPELLPCCCSCFSQDPLVPTSMPFSANPYQTLMSFSNSCNTCQQSLAGLSSHPSLFADTNGHPTFSTTADLFTPFHLLLPAHSEGLSYEYNQPLGQVLKHFVSIEQSHYFHECSLPIIYSLLICCLVYKHQW